MGVLRQNHDILEMERRERIRSTVANEESVYSVPDETLWSLWSSEDVISWTLSLENGRFGQYSEKLCDSMLKENVRGTDLSMIEDEDLVHFGIESDDRVSLLQRIRELVTKEQVFKSERD